MKLLMITGDRKKAAQKVADALQIKQVHSECDPKLKAEILNKLAKEGKFVAMVGDGLNDSVALKSAFVSISPANAIEITQNTADIIIPQNGVGGVLACLQVGKIAMKVIKQNLAFSLVYNAVTVPMAFFGLVNPIVAAIAMSSSSIVVVLNSLRIGVKNNK